MQGLWIVSSSKAMSCGKTCHKCKGKNHFATVCRTSFAKSKTRPRIQELEVEEEAEEEYFWVGQIESIGCEAKTKRWSVEAQVCDSKIKMKKDTGAETSTIPTKQWESIKRKPRLRKARATLKAFGNTCIESEGTAIVPITVGDKKIMTEVFVTKGQTTAVLGLQACTKLGLVQKGKNGRCIQTNAISLEKEKRKVNRTELLTTQDLQEKFKDVFEGVGSYSTQYHIQLKEEAVPVIQPPRRVPLAIMPELKKKLKEMEDNGIIEPVNEPTEWVHNPVIAQKPDGSLRLCLDPSLINC
ncbi:polyprotein [Elysia marginata]|uniref:Polyprotein n=1 Tax=Elysia marginata TaxID=1093978 RepID=A0AAV4GZD5_9GAST|nr:polyprotein [Elysia marginata]